MGVCIGVGVTYSMLFELKRPEFQKKMWATHTEVTMKKLEDLEAKIRKSLK